MKEELKTVDDLDSYLFGGERFIDKYDLKQLVIKWIKEDICFCGGDTTHPLIRKWIKRFNITEKELAGEGK